MNKITSMLASFCEDTHSYIFTFPEETFIDSSNGIIKIPLTDGIVGLAHVDKTEFDIWISGSRCVDIELFGFFHMKRRKFYLRNSVFSLFWKRIPERERPDFPVEYDEIPKEEMIQQFCEKMTEVLKDDILNESSSLKKVRGKAVERAFFRGFDGPKLKKPDVMSPYCDDFFTCCLLNNKKIALYLDDKDKWLSDAVDTACMNVRFYDALRSIMEEQLSIADEIKAVVSKKDHDWNKIKYIMDAVKGKKSVVIDIKKDGKEASFKCSTDAFELGSYYGLGLYGSWYIPKSDRIKLHCIFDVNNFVFGINDIVRVSYRGIPLYEAAKFENNNQ